jgi:hypothetical protein
VRLDTKIGAPSKLKIGDYVIATGDCGIRADNNAVIIATAPHKETIS